MYKKNTYTIRIEKSFLMTSAGWHAQGGCMFKCTVKETFQNAG